MRQLWQGLTDCYNPADILVKMITVMWDTFYSLLLTETVFCLNMRKYSFESHVMSCHGDTVIKCFKVPALQNSLTGLEQEMHQIFNNARDAELQSRGPGRNSQELSIILKTFFVIIILNQVTDNQTVKNNAIYPLYVGRDVKRILISVMMGFR